MVYRVVADGVDIFGSDTDSTLISPSLELELNSAGSLEFTLPPDHPAYDDVQLMQTEIEVYEDGDLIFFGRVSEVNIDWFKQKKVTCEGALAYLNDAAIRPHTFEGALISDVFKYIIAQYNAQVAQNRQITVGNITIVDRYVYTDFDYDICLSVLTSTCVDSTGGYLFVRKDDNDVMYIDWLAEIPDTSDQPVQFASNMLDLDQDTKADDVCTVVLPLGGQVDGVNITIASVNSGSDILENADGITKYGRILKIKSFGDIVDAQVLKDKAQAWLTKQQEEALTIEADAAELHYLDGSVGAYHIGQVVDVISGPHGINEEYPILKMSMDLDSGTKKVTLGTPPRKELTELSVSGGSSGSSSSGGGGGGGSSDGVRDVLVNGSSVVSDHVARVSAVTAQQLADGLALKADEDDFEALQTTVAGKASQADLNALSTTVAGKANTSEVNAALALKADKTEITEIEANPSDPATTDLTKLKVGNDIYGIPSGGSTYTAGDYININNDEISVNRNLIPNSIAYKIITKSTGNNDAAMTIQKYENGVLASSTDYVYTSCTGNGVNIDDTFNLSYNRFVSFNWSYLLLVDSKDHSAGYRQDWDYQTSVNYSEVFETEDLSGYKLITKEELEAQVVANPSEAATDDLTKVKIGDTIYDIPGGGSYTAGSHIDISNNEISVRLHDDSPLTPSEFDYTGAVQTYTAPYDAIYKLQVWGASGGDGTNGRSHAGYGGYTEGKISLTAGEVLYIYVGQAGVGGSSGGDSTRFNGGGKANHSGSWSRGSGGGATHIAKVSGLLSSLDQNVNDILVVAGGGGGAGYYSGNEYGTGGSGGGYIGGNGVMRTSGTAGTGATQQAGGTGAETGSFGKGADKSDTSGYGGSGGGGGFYGGGSSANTSGAGGGSGYYNPNLTDACMYGYEVSESSGSSNKTVSVSEYDADPVPQVAKSGNGYAIITCLGTTGTDLITREDMRESIEEAIEEANFNNLTMMSDYYSEDEQVVGRWTDGKPVYQKVVDCGYGPNSSAKEVNLTALNIDNCIQIGGYMCHNATSFLPIPRVSDRYIADQLAFSYNNSTKMLVITCRDRDMTAMRIMAILKYTKTTDAPGTGPTKGNLIYLPALYSEEEREVGVWTDGKPLYQKTVTVSQNTSTNNSSWTNVPCGTIPSNIEAIRKFDIIFMSIYQEQIMLNENSLYRFRFNGTDIQVASINNGTLGSGTKITIRYTKTTDAPGSGTWTPEGQLAHHYSTSEKIIGTWIDGSTVYERTWDFSANPISLPYDTWINTTIQSSDGVSRIISAKCLTSGFLVMDGNEIVVGAANYPVAICAKINHGRSLGYLTLQYTKTS